MPKKSLHMETTSISVIKTCSEIEVILSGNGVTRIWKDFDGTGNIEGISFILPVNGENIPFKLPFRWESIQQLADQGKTGYKKTADENQARKVAARIVLRWVEAQFALIEVGMAAVDEVFLPYVVDGNGTTFYESLKPKGGILALKQGKQ